MTQTGKTIRSRIWALLALTALLAVQSVLIFSGFVRYGCHPDELGARVQDIIGLHQWKPINYYYPTTHVYALKILLIGIIEPLRFKLHWISSNYATFFFNQFGRIITGLMSLGCTIIVFGIGRLLQWPGAVSIISTSFVASFPLFINLAHYNTTDIPNIFWMLLSIYAAFSAGIRHTRLSLVISGLVLGMATGVKYFGILIAPGLLVCLILSLRQSGKRTKNIILSVAAWCMCIAIGFIITTPAILFDTSQMLNDILFLKSKVPVWEGTDHSIGWVGIPVLILKTVNPILCVLMPVAIFATFRSKNIFYSAILINTVTLFLFMAPNHFYPQRFLMPLYIHILLLAGIACNTIWSIQTKEKAVGILAILILLTLQTRASLAVAWNFIHETRYESAQWITQNFPTSKVLLPKDIFTYFPVPFLSDSQIYDTRDISTANTPLSIPCSIRFAMTSSFYSPLAESSDVQILSYIKTHWKLSKQFKMQPVWGSDPASFTEFLSPTISIYQNPARCEESQ